MIFHRIGIYARTHARTFCDNIVSILIKEKRD